MTRLTLVVPAAGLGSRLSAIRTHQPKCLLSIGGRPILHYVLDAGLQASVERIVIVVNSSGDAIGATIGDRYAGIGVDYVHQSSPLGLAHAITLAAPYVSDTMLVINGDEIFAESHHKAAWRHFVDSGADAVVGYLRTDEPARISIGYGMDLAAGGRVLRLDEKPERPRNNVLGVGTWFLRRNWFAFYEPTPVNPVRGERDFVAVIQTMLNSGCDVRGFDLRGHFFNINTVTDLKRAREALESNTLKKLPLALQR